ncbi:MAG TPA: MBL fold metallo-hydrolase [Anaerolineae bacterium]|nr:MBL fold metallo-hydrolase [Anaerolineae bacterium]
MELEILGSGGAFTIPKPLCNCSLCTQARQQGHPYTRTGPSYFIHGPNILIDTPEEIKTQLNRAAITHINAAFYTHWHPDHTMGRRVWEMNLDPKGWPMKKTCTDIYIPTPVADDFRRFLGIWDHLAYLQQQELVHLHELATNDPLTIANVTVTPIPLAETNVFGYLFEENGRSLLLIADEHKDWSPPANLPPIDLFIIPMGVAEFNPFTNQRRIPTNHPILQREPTLRQTKALIAQLNPRQTIISHIEEPEQLSPDDLNTIADQWQADGLNVRFATDHMKISL